MLNFLKIFVEVLVVDVESVWEMTESIICFMEVPRFWREMQTNTSFTGKEKVMSRKEVTMFKYPGGEILLNGSMDEIHGRLMEKGFTKEATDEILFDLFGAVASESSISFDEMIESLGQLVGSEVRK